jgi:hypothetical protein
MRIPDKALDEFIEIYKNEFGEDISREDANAMASRLVSLYARLAKLPPNDLVPLPNPMQPAAHHPPIGFHT